MAFSFLRSTSHRPDAEHLEDEEEEDGEMPVQWSGGVRAFSHLPKQKKPWSNGTHELSQPPQAENQVYRKPSSSLDDVGMPSEPVNKPHFEPMGNSRERPFMPPEPVNKPYFGPTENSRQRPYRPPEPDYDFYRKHLSKVGDLSAPYFGRAPEPDDDVYRKPRPNLDDLGAPNFGMPPEADDDVYRNPPHHRPEDDYDFHRKPPNSLLDGLSHLEEDGDEDEMKPPARSGSVRAFSHLPERKKTEESDADIVTEQDDAASHEDFEAPVPDSESGSRHPDEPPSSIGAPPMAQSRLLEQRQMPPGWQAGSRDGGARAGAYAQNVAAPSGAARDESAVRTQAPAQGASPQQPGSGGVAPMQAAPRPQPPAQGSPAAPAQTLPPALAGAPAAPPPPVLLTVDPAHESAEFELTDRATKEKHKSPLTFGDHVRTIMRNEIQNSPTASRLLQYVQGGSGKPVNIKMAKPGDESQPHVGLDGSITLFINPDTLRNGTLTHEIVHQIQTLALKKASKPVKNEKTGEMVAPTYDQAKSRAAQVLNEIVPVIFNGVPQKDSNELVGGDGPDAQENEAMRAANIVNAELDAIKLRAWIDHIKKTDEKSYALILKDPSTIEKKFWEMRNTNEAVGHQNNQGKGMPIGTKYGNYNFDVVNQILGHGVKVQNSRPLQ